MRDSIGGVVNIFMIAVFLLLVSGYLAFSVSYNRAFRVKNRIINILEKRGVYDANVQTEINEFLKEIGYNATNKDLMANSNYLEGKDGSYMCDNGYCVAWIKTSSETTRGGTGAKEYGVESGYFKVTTSVFVDVPIVNKIMPYLKFLYVSGDTLTIYGDDAKYMNKEIYKGTWNNIP